MVQMNMSDLTPIEKVMKVIKYKKMTLKADGRFHELEEEDETK